MTGKDKILGIDGWPWIFQFLWFIPIMLSVFPVPGAIPVIIVLMVIDQPEEWPLIPIFFGWLSISVLLSLIDERVIKFKRA